MMHSFNGAAFALVDLSDCDLVDDAHVSHLQDAPVAVLPAVVSPGREPAAPDALVNAEAWLSASTPAVSEDPAFVQLPDMVPPITEAPLSCPLDVEAGHPPDPAAAGSTAAVSPGREPLAPTALGCAEASPAASSAAAADVAEVKQPPQQLPPPTEASLGASEDLGVDRLLYLAILWVEQGSSG